MEQIFVLKLQQLVVRYTPLLQCLLQANIRTAATSTKAAQRFPGGVAAVVVLVVLEHESDGLVPLLGSNLLQPLPHVLHLLPEHQGRFLPGVRRMAYGVWHMACGVWRECDYLS